MAGSINKVILVGHLGVDPEVRSFQNGGRVAKLSLGTSERWTDKTSGEKKERTEWHKVVVFNDQLVPIVERYLKKGSKVYLEGQVETRKYVDRDGGERYITEVVLRPYRGQLVLLDRAPEGQYGADAGAPIGGGAAGAGGRGSLPPADFYDDEVPF